jgi:hypothetical protein
MNKVTMQPEAAQNPKVYLYGSPANLPFLFASHTWLVVHNRGQISRWEVTFNRGYTQNDWGHLRKDHLPTISGIEVFPFTKGFYWQAYLLGSVSDQLATNMIQVIENSPQTYPYLEKYALTGPNSNTYTQWVLDQFPESELTLPWNAFGKNYR